MRHFFTNRTKIKRSFTTKRTKEKNRNPTRTYSPLSSLRSLAGKLTENVYVSVRARLNWQSTQKRRQKKRTPQKKKEKTTKTQHFTSNLISAETVRINSLNLTISGFPLRQSQSSRFAYEIRTNVLYERAHCDRGP